MKKYLNLIRKDLFIYKNQILIFLGLYSLVPFLFPKDTWKNGTISCCVCPCIMGVSFFLLFFAIEESKNKGTELLITTSYTRKDIIFSRYLMCLFLMIFQIAMTIAVMVYSLGNFNYINGKTFIIIFMFDCAIISIFVPLSFNFSYAKFMLSYIIVFAVSPILLGKIDMIKNENSQIFDIIVLTSMIIGIAIFFVSVYISNLLYNKKDF